MTTFDLTAWAAFFGLIALCILPLVVGLVDDMLEMYRND